MTKQIKVKDSLFNLCHKGTLRFITCGSVDDGKSTLIGRLLYESKVIYEDQLESLTKDSQKYGTQGDRLDFALLVDGLQAEREQGITIDVAYRFFSTENRRFIVADTPGHEQYTRNMATGASTADLAVILIDARKGILTQTRRHTRIVSLMGIKHLVIAINKMDLVAYREDVYNQIKTDYANIIDEYGFTSIQVIPISGLEGDNVVVKSADMNWYSGPSLLEYLENIVIEKNIKTSIFQMPIQLIMRPNSDFRGFSGRVSSGSISVGDRVKIFPSGMESTVKEIISCEKKADISEGDAITLTLNDEVDISRGDLIASINAEPQIADQFEAKLIWLSTQPMMPGRQYILKVAYKESTATVTEIKYKVDINSGAKLAAKFLNCNEIATVNIALNQLIACDTYESNKTLGSFILIDKLSHETVGAGMIDFALRRSQNILWQKLDINKLSRAQQKNQKPVCIWFTGFSGSGKSTIANLLEKKLFALGKHTYLLDGDNLRHGLNRDLGFTDADRIENIRRVAEVSNLMVDAGMIVLVSFISPFRAERDAARELFDQNEFIEVYVDTPIDICEKRDVKGLYGKARKGQLKNFTGIDSSYEAPINPEIHLKTINMTPEDCVDIIISKIFT
ncbi:sulfate adenylyltransferase subunit CysN [Flavobacterium sp.]|jgi:bifunctional enzyme CysN/CysC|uniref:sulfate adenylyltransferase subunit CysN n=1 Tax=Flavobacterium sp. TaxID=239 RepID=UPI0037BEB13A